MLLELCLSILPLLAAPSTSIERASSTNTSAWLAQDAHPVERERLVKLLDASDSKEIVATFRAHPGATLPFIDSFLEGGLAMIEKQGDAGREPAAKSFATGVRFATLADEAFPGAKFHAYANAFANWKPEEQKSFREGQKLYRAGMKGAKKDAAQALADLQSSLALATKLGDLWGMAMAHDGCARVAVLVGGDAQKSAREHARKAADLNRDVRLVDDWASSLQSLAAILRAEKEKPADVLATLREAWSGPLALPEVDAGLGRAIGEELVKALEADASAKDELAKVKRELEARFPAEPAKK